MPWPHQIHTRFARVPPNAPEEAYHGLYNKLLSYLFPVDTAYTVVPQIWEASGREIDYVESSNPLWSSDTPPLVELLMIRSGREWGKLGPSALFRPCMPPVPWALSTKLCFYRVSSGNAPAQIFPLAIGRNPVFVNDMAPINRWDCDVLEEDGEARLRTVVDEIRAALGH